MTLDLVLSLVRLDYRSQTHRLREQPQLFPGLRRQRASAANLCSDLVPEPGTEIICKCPSSPQRLPLPPARGQGDIDFLSGKFSILFLSSINY
jgi:hypothetical protein